MKMLIGIIGIFLTATSVLGGRTLIAGQTWTYEFTSLPFSHVETLDQIPSPYYPSPEAGFVMFFKSGFTTGESASYRIFDNNISESFAPVGQLYYDPFDLSGVAGYWQDLQGIVQITLLAGSMSLDAVHFRVHIPQDANSHSVYEQMILVPEPSAFSMAGCGAVTIWLQRRRIRTVGKALWLGRINCR